MSLAGEEDAPVGTLGDVAGTQHLPELLALAQLGLEHALLVVVHQVERLTKTFTIHLNHNTN